MILKDFCYNCGGELPDHTRSVIPVVNNCDTWNQEWFCSDECLDKLYPGASQIRDQWREAQQ